MRAGSALGTVIEERCNPVNMQPICTHKIGVHSATPSHAYPVIRLPRKFKGLIGKTANIYQTEHGGEPAFVITVGDSVGKFCAKAECSDTKARLAALESEIKQLRETLFSNETEDYTKNKNRWARGDLNARPSPCKGDVITS